MLEVHQSSLFAAAGYLAGRADGKLGGKKYISQVTADHYKTGKIDANYLYKLETTIRQHFKYLKISNPPTLQEFLGPKS